MSTYQNKTPGNKNQSFSAENTSAETDDNLFEYLDESPVAVAQRKLKDIADNSPKTSEISELQSIANKKFDPVSVSQKKAKKRNPLKELDNTIQLSEDLDNLNDETTIIEEKDARQKIREENPNLIEDDGSESNKQIEIDGKLTTTAKVKGFFGFNSTWDKFSKGVEKFNNSKKVVDKQKTLKEIKPLAREWLRRREYEFSKDKDEIDENDKIKRRTIYKFLNQTSSNYEQIKDSYEKTDNAIENLKSQITPQEIINCFNYYESFKNECIVFFRDYTADINLLYLDESNEINEYKQKLESSELTISSENEYDSGMGIKILSPELKVRLNGTASITGKVLWSYGELSKIEGTATAEFNKSGYIENSISIVDGSANTSIFGIDFNIGGLAYKFGVLSAKELRGQTTLFNRNITLSAIDFSFVNGSLIYDSIQASCEGDLKISNGIVITNPQGEYFPDGTLVFNGGFSLDLPNLANAEGMVEDCKIKNGSIQSIKIHDGKVSGDILGINFNLNKIEYKNHILSIASASGNLSIFGSRPFSMQAVGLNFDKEKNIDFDSISGEMPGVDVGFFHTEKTELAYDKIKNKYSGTTTYTFRNGEISENFKNFETTGNILIEYIPGNKPHLLINEGSMDFVAFGQSVNASKITYDSESPLSFSAGKIKLNTNIQGYNPNFEGENVIINQTGMHFGELSTEPNINPKPSLGPFTVNPKKLSILENNENGYTLKVDGQFDANFPNQFGSVTGQLEGGVTFSTFSSKMDYFISKGEAEMVAPNPISKVGDLFGGDWSGSRFEINADIPVFPGVFAVFGIFLAFNANFNDIIGNISIDKENNILIDLESGITGEIDAGVFGGIQAGSQLLAALAILLEMTASSNATLNLGYSKFFGMDDSLEDSDIDPKQNKEGFTYNLIGETKGSLKLSAVATALYFFQKRLDLVLEEASLGEFRFSNEENEKPNPKYQEFFSEEDLKRNVSDNVSEEAKAQISKMTPQQMLDIDVNRRFESGEKKEALDIFKSSEADRKNLQAEKSDGEDSFDDVPFTNLVFFNDFINKRINWDNLIDKFKTLPIQKCDQLMETEQGKQELRTIIEQMGEENNIASSFISFYAEKIKEVKSSIKGYHSIDNGYIEMLESKKELFKAAEKFKKDHLHSSFWGDEVRQGKNIRDKRSVGQILTFRNSGYEEFKQGLSDLYRAMTRDPRVIPIEVNKRRIQKKGSDYLLMLRKEHRNRNIEDETT